MPLFAHFPGLTMTRICWMFRLGVLGLHPVPRRTHKIEHCLLSTAVLAESMVRFLLVVLPVGVGL